MAGSRVTIVDIAREVGLSAVTVSCALNGTGRVSAGTAARVKQAAERLGYVSNRAARSLRGSRIGAFGLYIPPAVRNIAFYMDFAFGVSDGAALAGNDLTLFARTSTGARTFQVDGAIAIDPRPDDPVVGALLASGTPTISVGRYEGRGAEGIRGTLVARHAELQTEILDHLYRRGRRRPALIAVDDATSSWATDSQLTFTRWCAAHGIEPFVRAVDLDAAPRQVVAAVTAALASGGTDALVCAAQGLAAQGQIIVEARGLTIGRDLDLASFAGAVGVEIDNPLVSAIDLAPLAYGFAAAELLDDVLASPAGAPEHRWFDGTRVHLAT